MFCNLPRTYTAWDLIAEMSVHVAEHTFDFVNCPWEESGTANVGFGFVNFVDGEIARRVFFAMHGRSWRHSSTTQVVKISIAHVQGLVLSCVGLLDVGRTP